jgi:hypothetical protein
LRILKAPRQNERDSLGEGPDHPDKESRTEQPLRTLRKAQCALLRIAAAPARGAHFVEGLAIKDCCVAGS